jgi:hypothetical protein
MHYTPEEVVGVIGGNCEGVVGVTGGSILGTLRGKLLGVFVRVRCLVCFTLPAGEAGCAKPGDADCLTAG